MHNYTVKIENSKFTIEVSPDTNYGYFEHNIMGEDCGGGLWFTCTGYTPENFKVLELTDYDGVAVLPKSVILSLRENGFIVSADFE